MDIFGVMALSALILVPIALAVMLAVARRFHTGRSAILEALTREEEEEHKEER